VEKHTIGRDSRVREKFQNPFWHPSNAGHEESCMNLPGPSGKAKYSQVTDSEPVP
jgi:hypothetical protein